MRKILFLGISDGKVGSSKCGDCEHCYALPKGVPYFDLGGITFCEDCILSSDYTEEEVKLAKKDKKLHILPKADDYLMDLYFGSKEIRLIQTYKLDLKNSKSIPDKFKLHLYNLKNDFNLEKIKAESIIEMQNLVPDFINFLEQNGLRFSEDQFKEENKETFENAFHSSEPYFKSYKNDSLNELMDILKDYCFHNEKYQKELKELYTNSMEEFSNGRKKVLEDKLLVPFLEYHFKKISKGWPSHVSQYFKKWDIFKKKGKTVSVNLNKYPLMWGTYVGTGECDLDFRYDYDGDYEWEDELRYLDSYFKNDPENQCFEFFKKVNIKTTKNGDQLSFELLS